MIANCLSNCYIFSLEINCFSMFDFILHLLQDFRFSLRSIEYVMSKNW